MHLKLLRDKSWPGPSSGPQTALWEVQEVPGLIILNCSRHRCVGYQNGSFQTHGWMVVVRGNLDENHPARQIKQELEDKVFLYRKDALQAIQVTWDMLGLGAR